MQGKLDGTPLKGVVKVQVGHCMPELSPDGAFIAAVDHAGQMVQIYDVQSGTCISQQDMVVSLMPSRRPVVSLSWASGRCLVLWVQNSSKGGGLCPGDKPAQDFLSVFAF